MELFKRVPIEIFSEVPIDSNVMFLGERVNSINIGALLRHLIIVENDWISSLKASEDGDVIPLPQNAEYLDGINDGAPLIRLYNQVFEKGTEIFGTYDQHDLDKSISFFDRRYTVMGFLWIMFGHQSFHLGQVDLLMRQYSVEPPEYMEWPETEKIIA